MKIPFEGKWRGSVTGRNAGFSQRVVVSGAKSGNGAYNGIVGTSFVFEDGLVELQWNDNAGSGWQESGVISAIGMTSPLVTIRSVSADDNVPAERDGDYDDLQVRFEHIGPIFEVVQRPFALDRGTLVMFPDGIFDASQGLQYMGVRIRNTWFFDWESQPIPTGVKIGIAPASRTALASAGIQIVDAWTPQEQEAVGQVVDGGYVRVPDLRRGEETLVYFKIDVTHANPSKPDIGFVAQRDAFDVRFDEPTRVENKQIFISRSSYDPTTKELVAEVPEGTLRLKLNKVVLDRTAANKAAQDLMKCLRRKTVRGGTPTFQDLQDHLLGAGFWQDARDRERLCRERGSAMLRDLLRTLLAGRDIDICTLQKIIQFCCGSKDCKPCHCPPDGGGDGGGGGGHDDEGYPGGGWGDGTGKDGWCRVRPVFWLPLDFSYRITPNPAYAGQFGPLAFEDPWWKVILIILAVLLAIASLVYDYVSAGQDPKFIVGKVDQLGEPEVNMIDAATANLDGSRTTNLGALDAQSDDVNNSFPIVALDSILQLDRTDNGNNGIEDAVVGNVVWKSGLASATTRGIVNSKYYSFDLNYDENGGHDTISGTIDYENQVDIAQITGMEQPLSQTGDSGSVWVDMASRRPVALNFAGPEDDSGTYGTGNPIRDVVGFLKIRFNP